MKNNNNINYDEIKKNNIDQYNKELDQWKEVSEMIHGNSLNEIYMRASALVTTDEILNFKIKQIKIQIGMDLLPLFDDKLSENERDNLKSIYDKAKSSLKKAYTMSRRTEFSYRDHGDKKFEVYQIISEDEDIEQYDSRPVDIHNMLLDYRRNQFEQCSKKLEDIDNEIRHALTQYDVIKKTDPDIVIDKTISNTLEIIFRREVAKFISEVKDAK